MDGWEEMRWEEMGWEEMRWIHAVIKHLGDPVQGWLAPAYPNPVQA